MASTFPPAGISLLVKSRQFRPSNLACRNPMFATEGGDKVNLRCAELQTSFIT